MKQYTVHEVHLVNVCHNYTNNNCILLMSVMRTQTVWAKATGASSNYGQPLAGLINKKMSRQDPQAPNLSGVAPSC